MVLVHGRDIVCVCVCIIYVAKERHGPLTQNGPGYFHINRGC